MHKNRILIADDEKEITDLLKKYLVRECYEVDTATNGEEVIKLTESNNYNLIILDLMMPKLDGIETCRILRTYTNVPILMLTAKDLEGDKILGLSIGADDYITKPFSINEVIARVKALVRRFIVLGSDNQNNIVNYRNLKIDFGKYLVIRDGEKISFTSKEFELLKLLILNKDQVFTKTQIFNKIWGDDYLKQDDNTVMVHIRRLRKKIEENPSNPKLIQTVWGVGYKFAGEAQDEE